MEKIVAVTGCDSGIGRALAVELASRGYAVLASCLDDPEFPPDRNMRVLRMDITNGKQREAFAAAAMELARERTFFCLVNNAGIGLGGPVEDLPLDAYREVFEVNFFGLVSLTQKLIPLVIRDRGRIVNIGSMAGRIALPFMSPYVSSKFALEGFTDSLRRELRPFGVKTVLVEPGGIATPIWNKARRQDMSFAQEKYRKSLDVFGSTFVESGNRGMDAAAAAREIARILGRKRPAPRYIVAKSRLVSALEARIPDRVFDAIAARLFSMDYGDSGKG